ncbi:cupin domain-containing protein [Acuticoccus sp. I52.16.1]|uniref:cupin domain-containing protein n=1 Tax=Acuticoccus sp. I52.16.1 TaxID=2928472 RepID=UPI001FD00954|nr:cupin domain-containing protein [Acuticoccus sp. I52.16.1]UOM33498.1 cupin domain-containing protein [Acuticoccus sp. I52.16.1]
MDEGRPTGVTGGNIFAALPGAAAAEDFATLAARPGVRVERIVSHGHTTPAGTWYDQAWDEWVLVLEGEAAVLVEGEASPRSMRRGDHLFLPRHVRHRVVRTAPDRATVWLAVHFGEPGDP